MKRGYYDTYFMHWRQYYRLWTSLGEYLKPLSSFTGSCYNNFDGIVSFSVSCRIPYLVPSLYVLCHRELLIWQKSITSRIFCCTTFSYFYTHRTNRMEQFRTSTLPWREKLPYCENVYHRLGTPAVFKFSPLVSPDFDYVLESRGYEIQHMANVMTVGTNSNMKTAGVYGELREF